ncbi:MAG: fused response regulator/phosphatase [Oleiphilaceae bacterium]|nr:fused response regulator/phosphatase [Oleiphilaceae bacterium]
MPKLKILIVEDSAPDRMLLDRIVRDQGFQTIAAENGRQAIDLYRSEKPSIVLMDALMPEMDGKEATRQIKQIAGDTFVPILFLTSLTDDEALVSCLEAGGDDFLSKPYRPVVIAAKIQVFERMLQLHRTLKQQRDEIAKSNEHFLQEQLIAKKVYDNVAHMGCLDQHNIKHVLSPMSVFNGDVLLSARKPSGGLVVFLGDFTGHGLPAAIGAMPLAEIFYSMVAKGFGCESILHEINLKLKSILPVGFFCCAAMIDMSYSKRRVRIWNGGLPDLLLRRAGEDGEITHIVSEHLPLGILAAEKFDAKVKSYDMQIDDRLYVWSDGIVELRNTRGEAFGLERLQHCVESVDAGDIFEQILAKARGFVGEGNHEDDLTLAEITMIEDKWSTQDQESLAPSTMTGARDWQFSYEMFGDTIRDFNPIPLMLHVSMEVPELKGFNQDLYTLYAELISNAIDHGLLKLDSSLKSDAEGFKEYYAIREQRLQDLDDEYVRIVVRHYPDASGGRLMIRVEDSGEGFDVDSVNLQFPDSQHYAGRGLPLVRSLCESLEFKGPGNIVEAHYRWKSVNKLVKIPRRSAG